MSLLTLYRGDYTKINQFDFHKTYKHCLVGPGIYLTDSKQVAATYCIKGATGQAVAKHTTLFVGQAENRLAAFERAFERFVEPLRIQAGVGYKDKKALHKFQEAQRPAYKQLIEDGRIVANYLSSHRDAKGMPTLEVVYERDRGDGYITEFAFARQTIEPSVIRIDRCITDTLFWELMWDRKIKVGESLSYDPTTCDRSTFVQRACYLRMDATALKTATAQLIRAATQPYGYLGFEYTGGTYILRSNRQHRAFCLWDDEFVNQHRVKRFRP